MQRRLSLNTTLPSEPVLCFGQHRNSCRATAHIKAEADELHGGHKIDPQGKLPKLNYRRVYFCLLNEIFGDIFDTFMCEQAKDGVVLNTAQLRQILKVWAQKLSSLQACEATIELQRVEAVLRNTIFGLTNHNEQCNESLDSSNIWLLETYCIIEALNLARLSVLACTDKDEPYSTIDYYARFQPLERSMIKHGWCPNHIKMCYKTFGISSLYFASGISRRPRRSHETCSQDRCLAYSYAHRSPVTTHMPQVCSCELLSVPKHTLASMIEAGVIPLVQAQTNGDGLVDIHVVAYHSGRNFTAVSHVWSHGLGDETGNSLRRCEVNKIIDFIGSSVKSPRLFWLDTLCVPREPFILRRKAIEGIRKVYEQAATVLALDEELVLTSVSGMAYEEILIRLHTSGWMRRLWTLHEQSRARNVYFQFADGTYGQNELIEDFEKDVKAHKEAGIPYFKVVPARGIALLKKLTRIKSGKYMSDTFVDLWSLLRWRHLSWPEDETICMANILGLSPRVVDDLLNTAKELRMQKFLALFKYYPAALLFLQTEKLQISGYRWAPVSWRHRVEHLDELLNLRVHANFIGRQVERGLIISCSTIRLDAHESFLKNDHPIFGLSIPDMNSYFHISSQYLNASTLSHLINPITWQLAICLETDLSGKCIRGALVEIVETTLFEHQIMTYARYLSPLRLERTRRPRFDLYEESESISHAHTSLENIVGEYSDRSLWCIG